MKLYFLVFKFLLIISLFGLNLQLLSQDNVDQSMVRVQKKHQVSFYSSNFLGLAYNFNVNKHFSLGLSYLNKNDSSHGEIKTEFTFLARTMLVYSRNVDANKKYGFFDAKFFPFEKFPIYFQVGLGKALSGVRMEDIPLYYVTNSGISSEDAIKLYSIDLIPAYLRKFDLGFQWVFGSGLILNLQMSDIKSIFRPETNVHFYHNVNNVGRYIYLLAIRPTPDERLTFDYTFASISIGYAF